MRTRGEIADWRQFDACAESAMELRFAPGCKRCGDTYSKDIQGVTSQGVTSQRVTRRVFYIAFRMYLKVTHHGKKSW